MSDLQQLKSRFTVPGAVEFEAGQGGLPRIAITTHDATAHVYLHGAHVTHYCPLGGRDVMFMSEKSHFEAGKPIRGGIPICFPWFGPKAGDPAAPAHGFARTSPWDLVDVRVGADGMVSVVLELKSSDASRKLWPHDFVMRYTVSVSRSLDLALEVRNAGAAAFTFEEALHTYLAIGDVRLVKVDGLTGRDYLDKVDGAKRKRQQPGAIAITGETDRVYLHTGDVVSVTDPTRARRLSVDKDNSRTTVLWNPWINKARAMPDFGDDEWPGMICVETANASENAVTLLAGQSHRMAASITAVTGAVKDDPRSSQWEMSGTGRGQ